MVLSGIVSRQAGAGIAARLLHEIPPGLRLWTSAVAIAVIAGRRLAQAFGDLAKGRAWPSWPHPGRAEAGQRLRAADKARTAYVRRLYRCDPADPAMYHLMIDSTAIPLDTVTELIVITARAH